MSARFVTVFIPVLNGEAYLRQCIESVLSQKLPKEYLLELRVTDSGSSDSSVDIIKSFGNQVTFDEIPNTEFGHGKTRQRAVEASKGEFVVFLTQDAIPANEQWLINMIEPFFLSNAVGCVYGRQIPRPFAVPTIKREVATVFSHFGVPGSIAIQRSKSLTDGSQVAADNGFFSDVNSAIRKDLNARIPFRDVPYAEDQALAADMQEHGYLKAYAPDGAVTHSNDYTAKEYLYRKFDEYRGLINTIEYDAHTTVFQLITSWVRPTVKDWVFTLRDKEYTPYLKLKYVFIAPLYNFLSTLGKYRAYHHRSTAHNHEHKFSLETKNKQR